LHNKIVNNSIAGALVLITAIASYQGIINEKKSKGFGLEERVLFYTSREPENLSITARKCVYFSLSCISQSLILHEIMKSVTINHFKIKRVFSVIALNCLLANISKISDFLFIKKVSSNPESKPNIKLHPVEFTALLEVYFSSAYLNPQTIVSSIGYAPSMNCFTAMKEFSFEELKNIIRAQDIDRDLVKLALNRSCPWEIMELLIERMPRTEGLNEQSIEVLLQANDVLIEKALVARIYPKSVVKLLIERGEPVYPGILMDFLTIPDRNIIITSDVEFIISKGAAITPIDIQVAQENATQEVYVYLRDHHLGVAPEARESVI
ncbi:MAG: hypothetical protein HKM07_02535, partial [Chlamydiae bacterium]|nr:hypothetical protein [Chlamydiota bacterium]